MQPCARLRPTYLQSHTQTPPCYSSHMTNGILLIQLNQEITQCPFLMRGWGLGTRLGYICHLIQALLWVEVTGGKGKARANHKALIINYLVLHIAQDEL